jgi:hypothetical protein
MAGVIGIPLLAAIQDGFGWRAASIGSGIIVWVVGLPVTRGQPGLAGQAWKSVAFCSKALAQDRALFGSRS